MLQFYRDEHSLNTYCFENLRFSWHNVSLFGRMRLGWLFVDLLGVGTNSLWEVNVKGILLYGTSIHY